MTSTISPRLSRTSMRRLRAACAVALLITVSGCSSADQGNDSSPTPAAQPSSASSPAGAATPDQSSKDSSPATPSASAEAVVITIKDYAYAVSGSVAPGAEITVKNDDSVAHTVTADEGAAFDVVVAAGSTETLSAPSKAGNYAFHCTYHNNMTGTLVVS